MRADWMMKQRQHACRALPESLPEILARNPCPKSLAENLREAWPLRTVRQKRRIVAKRLAECLFRFSNKRSLSKIP
jgi:hypothetical protein